MPKSLDKINICGSSFLIPNNECWTKVSELGKSIFSEYGNFSNSLLNTKKNEVLILILSIVDLIDRYEFNKKKNNLVFKTILSYLEKRLKDSNKITIIALDTFLDFSTVSISKLSPKIKTDIEKFKSNLYRLSSKFPHFFIVDLDNEFSKYGFYKCLDNRNWYFAHCRYSLDGLEIISNSVTKILQRYYNPACKVLVLDCDNTLWGGVLGEEGVHGVTLGSDGIGEAYVDFQKAIKKLSNEGTLIVLSSKNNEKDVWEIFKKNKNMILKRKDIIDSEINWNEKFLGLKKISNRLSLGLDSFVFWDDNPLERQKIKANCPEVNVIDVPKNIYEWPSKLINLDKLSKFRITKEDYKKRYQYKARSKFLHDRDKNNSNINFLKKIKIKPKITKLNKSLIRRASQMSLKTNQFNFRSKRYSEKDISEIIKKKTKDIYLLSFKDIYADHGNIGMVAIDHINGQSVFIDTFLMSCRILGRDLEKWFISEIVKICKLKKKKYIFFEFLKSKKNQVAWNFLKDKIFFEIKDFSLNGKTIKKTSNKRHLFKIDINKFNFKNKKMYG